MYWTPSTAVPGLGDRGRGGAMVLEVLERGIWAPSSFLHWHLQGEAWSGGRSSAEGALAGEEGSYPPGGRPVRQPPLVARSTGCPGPAPHAVPSTACWGWTCAGHLGTGSLVRPGARVLVGGCRGPGDRQGLGLLGL